MRLTEAKNNSLATDAIKPFAVFPFLIPELRTSQFVKIVR